MKNLFQKIKKFLPHILLISFVFYFSFGVGQVQAAGGILQLIGGFSLSAITSLVNFFLELIGMIFGVLIKLVAILVNASMGLNHTLSEDVSRAGGFIYNGWSIFRDVANLGFVLGIIIIAIATILRYKSYTYKETLTRLIVVALLVNFSLVIAGMVIKTSDIFSNQLLGFFDSSGGGNPSEGIKSIGPRILGQFDMQKLVLSGFSSAKSESGEDLIVGDLGKIITNFIKIIFLGLMFLVLLSFAGTLLIRYFKLAFMLIVLPAVLLTYIFPAYRKHWTKWSGDFIHWVLYMPVLLFFMWLAVTFMSQSGLQDVAVIASKSSDGSQADIGGLKFRDLLQPIMGLAIFMAGLKTAKELGYGGTELALNAFDKASAKTKKWAKTKSRRGYERTKSGLLQSKAGQKFQAGMAKVPLVGGKISRQLKREEISSTKESGAHIREFQDSLKGMNTKDKLQILPTLRGEKRFALIQDLLNAGVTQKQMNLSPQDLQALNENDLRFNREDKLAQKAMEGMKGDDLAQARDSLTGDLREQADVQIAIKGAMSKVTSGPLNLDNMIPIINNLKAKGQMDQVKKILTSMGLNSQAVTILTAIKDAELHGGTSALEYEINGVKRNWGTAELQKEMAIEQDNIRSSQSSDDLKLSIKNRGGDILDPANASKFYGSNIAGQTIVASDVDHLMENPSKIRTASSVMDPTQRNELKEQAVKTKLHGMSERIKQLNAKKVAGTSSKKEEDLLTSLIDERTRFGIEAAKASTSGDYRNLGKMMSDSSSSSMSEVRDIGRAIR